VVRCTDADLVRLQDTVFAHFRRLNALELKGPQDPLTLADYNRVMFASSAVYFVNCLRVWGLGALEPEETLDEKAVEEEPFRAAEQADREADQLPSQRTVTIVCVTRPDRILDWLREELGFLPTVEPGIYLCDERLPQWIIYPTELSLAPRNYPLF
jgi:hypothetical protein